MTDQLLNIYQKSCATMKQWPMLQDNDRVLIGLSGGKDSLALTEVLSERQKIFVPRIEVIACHISVNGKGVMYQSDVEYLKDFCDFRGVRFVHKEVTLEEDKKEGRSKCWLCSWTRRKALFHAAEELNCNKLALGHHIDDIAETLLMNEIFTGRFESIPPVLKMDKFPLTIIRPLCEIREKSLQNLANEQGYHKQERLCPYEDKTNRQRMKQLVEQLRELNPNVTESLFTALYGKDGACSVSTH